MPFLRAMLFLLVCGMLFTACKKKCTPECFKEGGDCDGKTGTCICKPQYFRQDCSIRCVYGKEGVNCDTLSRDKFVGVWNNCKTRKGTTGSATVNHPLEIDTPTGLYFTNIRIINVNGEGYYFICNMQGVNLFQTNGTIVAKNPNGTSAGIIDAVSGSIKSNGQLDINLTKDGENYFCTCTK